MCWLIDSGPAKKVFNKGDGEEKLKSVSKKFFKAQVKPGNATVKQFKNNQQPEKFGKKRKLQDAEEGGEQIFKPGCQGKTGFGKQKSCSCSSRSSSFCLPSQIGWVTPGLLRV